MGSIAIRGSFRSISIMASATAGKRWPVAEFIEDYDDYDDGSDCYNCGGGGWFVDCIDDMCHGQDECIHGDPPSPCRVCNADGHKDVY